MLTYLYCIPSGLGGLPPWPSSTSKQKQKTATLFYDVFLYFSTPRRSVPFPTYHSVNLVPLKNDLINLLQAMIC